VPPTSAPVLSTGDVEGFDVATITLDGDEWLVAVAATGYQHLRGLMFVEDLGDLKGMLFVFDGIRTGGFWMKNTLIPLDIAFFDDAGAVVDVLTMVPCEADPCPSYTPVGAYRYALEAPAGTLEDLPVEALLQP
jgi:uncharacterized membrane protein (UPF0127 family)